MTRETPRFRSATGIEWIGYPDYTQESAVTAPAPDTVELDDPDLPDLPDPDGTVRLGPPPYDVRDVQDRGDQ